MRTCIAFVFLSSTLIGGCSTAEITPGHNGKGYGFYAPKPLLVLSCNVDDKGNVTQASSIKYVPDFSAPYTLEVKNRLGSNDVTAAFADGWMLTSYGTKYQPPTTTIDKLIDVADKAMGPLDAPVTKNISCKNYVCELGNTTNIAKLDKSTCMTYDTQISITKP